MLILKINQMRMTKLRRRARHRATSFAARANEISGNAVCGNINYADCRSGTWPIGEGKWRHSDIKNVAYFFNWKLFKLIINSDRGVSNANQQ